VDSHQLVDDAILQAKGKIREKEQVPFEMVRSVVYNLPSAQKDAEKASKLPAALQPVSQAAKSIATGIQSSVNQVQTKITNVNDHVVKALGIEVPLSTDADFPTKPHSSSDSLSSMNRPTPSTGTSRANAANYLNRPSMTDFKPTEVSMADKWEAELRRLKEEAKKAEAATAKPPPAYNFNHEKPNFKDMKFEIPDGVLVPQPRSRPQYQESSTASSPAHSQSSFADQHYHHEDETKSRFRPAPPDPFKPSFLSPAYDEFPPIPVPRAAHPKMETSSDTPSSTRHEETFDTKAASVSNEESHVDSHVVPASHKGCGCVLM
jgi:hypothetical protein